MYNLFMFVKLSPLTYLAIPILVTIMFIASLSFLWKPTSHMDSWQCQYTLPNKMKLGWMLCACNLYQLSKEMLNKSLNTFVWEWSRLLIIYIYFLVTKVLKRENSLQTFVLVLICNEKCCFLPTHQ